MKLSKSQLRKIIREELEAVQKESKFDDRFNALQNATADILNALGKRRADLSPRERERLSNLAARVVDDLITPEDAAKKIGAPVNEAVEHDEVFKHVVEAGIVMGKVDRKKFFNFLRARDLTTLDAIKNNRGPITAWLKDNR